MRAVNLIPSDQRRGGVSVGVGAGRSGGAAYAVLALLVGVALLVFMYAHAKHQVTSRGNEASALKAKALTLESEVSTLSPYTTFINLREARQTAVASLVDSRFDWAHVFHEFGRVLPSNISVSSLDGKVGTAVATAPAPASPTATPSAGSTTPPGSVPSFTIAGCGTSQRAVATMLQRLRLIDGVSDVTLQSSTKGGTGATGAGGGCGPGQPSFTATITFQALPSTEAAAAAATGKGSAPATASTPAAPATGAAQ